MSRSRKLWSSLLAFCFAWCLAVVIIPQPASAASGIHGTVKCSPDTANDNEKVVGVWVDDITDPSLSGWAGHSSTHDNALRYTWGRSEIPLNHEYTVSVGCGGSPSNWEQTINTYPNVSFTGTEDIVCANSGSVRYCG